MSENETPETGQPTLPVEPAVAGTYPHSPAGQAPPGPFAPAGQTPPGPIVPAEPVTGVPSSGFPATAVPQSDYPTYPGQSAYGAAGVPWAPSGTQRKGTSGAVKFLAGSAAAIVLALGSGLAGAVIATQFMDKGRITVNSSTPVSAAPIVDRKSLAGVAATVEPSVVNIATGSGEGSGVVLREDGYILTNNHVVANAAGKTVTVTLNNGKKVPATIVGTDPKTDLAVIKANTTGLIPATFGNSDAVAVGDTVLAIGSPLGLKGSVTAGIISAKDRTISVGENRGGASMSGLLQTDAPINPGNSGGALVNTASEVVGVNSAIATNGSGEGNIGVGFAIPSNKAKQIAEQIMNGEKVSHPYLGVSVTAAEAGGAQVGGVTENSPAAKAGLQKGDIITKFGSKVINSSDDLVSAVQSGKVGEQVTVEFTRNGEAKTATVTLAEAS